MPANTDFKVAFSRLAGGVSTLISDTSTLHNTNIAQLDKYTADGPTTYKKPPMAGPTMIATCVADAEPATARGSSEGCISVGSSAVMVGLLNARPAPITNTM